MKEIWNVNQNEKVIYPQDLVDNPNEYGGMGLHMKLSIINDIVTVPLKKGSIHVSIPVSQTDAERIILDGGVDIYSNGYWSSIKSVDVMFKDTDQKIIPLNGLF